MEKETLIRTVEEKLSGLLSANPSHFLVDIKVKPTNNIKVFVDADEGINLTTLVSYNRNLYKLLEETGMFPEGDFSLEVSSPGLDEPLKMHRQYKKNVGRSLALVLNDGTTREGKLVEATEDGVIIEFETGKGKQKQTKQETILFSDMKSAKIQVKF